MDLNFRLDESIIAGSANIGSLNILSVGATGDVIETFGGNFKTGDFALYGSERGDEWTKIASFQFDVHKIVEGETYLYLLHKGNFITRVDKTFSSFDTLSTGSNSMSNYPFDLIEYRGKVYVAYKNRVEYTEDFMGFISDSSVNWPTITANPLQGFNFLKSVGDDNGISLFNPNLIHLFPENSSALHIRNKMGANLALVYKYGCDFGNDNFFVGMDQSLGSTVCISVPKIDDNTGDSLAYRDFRIKQLIGTNFYELIAPVSCGNSVFMCIGDSLYKVTKFVHSFNFELVHKLEAGKKFIKLISSSKRVMAISDGDAHIGIIFPNPIEDADNYSKTEFSFPIAIDKSNLNTLITDSHFMVTDNNTSHILVGEFGDSSLWNLVQQPADETLDGVNLSLAYSIL